jgi:hypothetical protein
MKPHFRTWVQRFLYLTLSIFLISIFVNTRDEESPDIKLAQGLLENQYLSSPSTAKWHEKRVIKTEGLWVQTYFRLDAQNAYGATVRANLCVVHSTDRKGWIFWDKQNFVLDRCLTGNEKLLKLHRDVNNWGSNRDTATAP